MQLRSNWINKFNTNFLFYKTKLVHSTALFFCVLFSLISNHFFAQILIKNIILVNYKIQQKIKVLIIVI